MASFTKAFNPRLAERPLETNGRLDNLELTSLVKEVTGVQRQQVPRGPVITWILQLQSHSLPVTGTCNEPTEKGVYQV